jgi:hypothetical protein
MALIKKLINIVLFSTIIMNISGCTTILIYGHVTKNLSYASSYIDITKNNGNVLDMAAETGKEMGYKEAKRESNLVLLSNSSRGTLSDIIAGVYKDTDIKIEKNDDKLFITVIAVASYGNAREDYCEEVLNNFKANLSLRLNQ